MDTKLSDNRSCSDRCVNALSCLMETRYKVLVLLLLMVNICMCGLAKGQNDIDSIRVTYDYYIGGYGTYRSTACYAYHRKGYKLLLEKSYNVQNAWQLPKTISQECVSKLLDDCNLYSTEDRCEFIKITKDDYSSYIKIINDKDSLEYYLGFTYIFDFKKEQFELEEDAFLSLSSCDIANIIESPTSSTFFLYKPTMIIELISNKSGSITIEPQWYFDGTAWKVQSQGKARYVGNQYIMSFLKDIQYDKYLLLWERFYLLLHIVEGVKEKGTKPIKMEILP